MENRMRVLRAERRWSQEALAERVGVSRQAVNAVETGKHDPSLMLAFKVALAFGLTIEDVFDPKLDRPPETGEQAVRQEPIRKGRSGR